ncbi:MAG: riboflavin biosynthesis protein RibF [Phycisphaerae bacterium]
MVEQYINGLDAVPATLKGCALAIGNFDGVHLGHQRIIRTARALAAVDGSPVVAMTLEPPPEMVLRPQSAPCRILPHEVKARLLVEAGADVLVTAVADRELLGMSARDFVERIIMGRFGARHVVEGRDFHFGSKRGGDVGLLGLMGCHYGFAMHVQESVMIDTPGGQERISSSLVRRLVAEGNVELARQAMGRPFTLYGPIVAGQGRGRLMEYPTANIDAAQQIAPADGVYAGRAVVEGRPFPAAISVGHKLTLGPEEQLFIEAFLIGADEDIYGRRMELSFLRRLRGQQKFAGVEELKAAIARDVAQVREIVQT